MEQIATPELSRALDGARNNMEGNVTDVHHRGVPSCHFQHVILARKKRAVARIHQAHEAYATTLTSHSNSRLPTPALAVGGVLAGGVSGLVGATFAGAPVAHARG